MESDAAHASKHEPTDNRERRGIRLGYGCSGSARGLAKVTGQDEEIGELHLSIGVEIALAPATRCAKVIGQHEKIREVNFTVQIGIAEERVRQLLDPHPSILLIQESIQEDVVGEIMPDMNRLRQAVDIVLINSAVDIEVTITTIGTNTNNLPRIVENR